MPKEAPECERQGGGNLRIPKLLLEALVVVEVMNNMDPKLPKPRKGGKEKQHIHLAWWRSTLDLELPGREVG